VTFRENLQKAFSPLARAIDEVRPRWTFAKGPKSRAETPMAAPASPAAALRFSSQTARFFGADRPVRLQSLLPEDAPAPDPTALLSAQHEPVSGSPLIQRLQQTAREIADGQKELKQSAEKLAQTVQRRRDGAVATTIWVARLLIGVVLLFVAGEMVIADLNNTSARSLLIGEVQAAEVRDVLKLLALFGGVACVLAFMGGLFTRAARIADNDWVKKDAKTFGSDAANLALKFDADLDRFLDSMGQKGDPLDAVTDLSNMHLTAVHAAVFFRELGFLMDEQDADLRFRGYLQRNRTMAGDASGREGLAFLLGMAVGAFGVLASFGALPMLANFSLGSGVHEGAALLVFVGAVLWATIGLFGEAFRGLIQRLAEPGILSDALIAAQGGYGANNAPRVGDVTRTIEQAIGVYRARIKESRAKSGGASHDSDEPTWRRGPEPPRFVSTGFQSAPPSFTADAPKTPRLQKLFGAPKPKRG
jgi:hypothetical protein